MERFEMRVSGEWLEMLDLARGEESRSAFVRRLVEGALGGSGEGTPAAGPAAGVVKPVRPRAVPAGPVTSGSPKPVDHVTAAAFNVQRSPAERRFG